jgi:small-conductance mechanosensitive channel
VNRTRANFARTLYETRVSLVADRLRRRDVARLSDVTGEHLSGLPSYFHEHTKVLVQTPLRIVLIIVVALVLRSLLHRMINRLVRPIEDGAMPKILSPLKERGDTILATAGLLSQRRRQRAGALGSILKSSVSFVIFAIGFMMIVNELGFDLAPLIAGTSIVGVALGFGAQNVVKDFLSGMFMIFEDQYGVGDVIDFEQATGTVEAVGLRTTRLRDVEGTVWYVRNGEVVRVGNKSQGFAQVVLDVPVDARLAVGRASEVILSVAQELYTDENWSGVFLAEPEVQGVESMTLDETVIRLVMRVRPLEQWRAARELRGRLRTRLDQLGVSDE